MKIGILTQPLVNNYGGILQNFALQLTLKDLGHYPVTINFEHTPLKLSAFRLAASVLKRLFFYVFKKKSIFLNPYKEDSFIFAIRPEQKRFIRENITKFDTNCVLHDQDFLKDFDAFVVGSDQVWRPMYSPHINNFFLDFANEKQKKIAYAASFGTDNWEFSKELTKSAKSLLQRFNGVSVREKSGVDLCKSYLSIDAIQVLDPTFLVSQEVYSAIADRTLERKEICYVATYILDSSDQKTLRIEDIASMNHFEIVKLGTEQKGVLQSIEGWLSSIKYAKFVVTDSFHGTVFSMIFHKPFVTFYNPERGNSRLESILKTVGLENRLCSPVDFNEKNLKDIDWERVDIILDQMKQKSLAFLKSSLNDD